jgi:hypothetical protein
MNVPQLTRIAQIARAIRFKEYLLGRDVSSRRIIIEHCIKMLYQSPHILAWFENLRGINDQLDSKDRKEQIKVDAYWEDLIVVHSSDMTLSTMMSWFMSVSL